MYSFRIRFELPKRLKINIDSNHFEMPKNFVQQGGSIQIKSHKPEVKLNTTTDLRVVGEGYPSEALAEDAANSCKQQLVLAFSRMGIGADFGERKASGFFTEYGLNTIGASEESPVLNDVHGTMVYLTTPKPMFARVGGVDVLIGKPPEQLQQCFIASRGRKMSSRQILAYELFSASFFQQYADTRFLLLMMAVETLITQKKRSAKELTFISELVKSAEQTELLNAQQKITLINSIKALESESTRSAGKMLSMKLGNRIYMELLPVEFFNACYNLRSNLVHGYHPRPTIHEVGVHSASLELFVGNLISEEILDLVDIG